jgi:hypothetical protein
LKLVRLAHSALEPPGVFVGEVVGWARKSRPTTIFGMAWGFSGIFVAQQNRAKGCTKKGIFNHEKHETHEKKHKQKWPYPGGKNTMT